MALHIIGLGLYDGKDISLKGLERIKQCDVLYLDAYTSILHTPIEELEELYGKKIIIGDRTLVEQKAEETILKDAKEKETAFLVIGDSMAATTHADLFLRAKELGIEVTITHSSSILTAVGVTGLQLYKFGKTASIPYQPGEALIETPYNYLKENGRMHTLFLLDIKAEQKRYMTVNEAITYMLKLESVRKEGLFTENTFCVGCARLGGDQKIVAGKAKELLEVDFGGPLHVLIVPGEMHFVEEDVLKVFSLA